MSYQAKKTVNGEYKQNIYHQINTFNNAQM